MQHLSRRTWIAFVIAALAGSGLHFLHTLLPCPVTALFAPVNESLWEHLKLLFWPGLTAALVLARRGERALLPARLLALLAGAALMEVLGFLYHITLGGGALWVDIALYLLLMAGVVILPAFLPRTLPAKALIPLAVPVALLGAAVLLFTFLPPTCLLFADLAAAPR